MLLEMNGQVLILVGYFSVWFRLHCPKAVVDNTVHFVGFVVSHIQGEEIVIYSELGTIFSCLFTAD